MVRGIPRLQRPRLTSHRAPSRRSSPLPTPDDEQHFTKTTTGRQNDSRRGRIIAMTIRAMAITTLRPQMRMMPAIMMKLRHDETVDEGYEDDDDDVRSYESGHR